MELTEGDLVRWNSDGTKFAVICASTLTIYGIVSRSRFQSLRIEY
jgi:hypothetical protein